MGASSSSCSSSSSSIPGQTTRLDDLPESCIALVLSHLSPVQIADIARVNSAFHRASSADFIWVPKLPPNFMYILSKLPLLPDQGGEIKHKMDIYARLCRSCPFDGGTKHVWIDKKTGGVCLAVSSQAMTITGIDDRRYWSRIAGHDTRFETVAYLKKIWWLEVSGRIEFPLPTETYSLFFRLHLGRACKGRASSDEIDGWDVKPTKFQLNTQDGQSKITHFKLNNVGNWSYYHVGDFTVNNPGCDSITKLDFSLTQIDCTHIKRGLCVDCVLICPRSLATDFAS